MLINIIDIICKFKMKMSNIKFNFSYFKYELID